MKTKSKLTKFLILATIALLSFTMMFVAVGCNNNGSQGGNNNTQQGPIINVVQVVTFKQNKISLVVGDEQDLGAKANAYLPGVSLTFKSSNENVVKVDNYGFVTALAKGNATVTATYGSYSSKCTIEVTHGDLKPELVLKNTYNGEANISKNIPYSINPAIIFNAKEFTNAQYTYSFDKSFLNVDTANNTITGLKKGTTQLTISASWDGVSGISTLTKTIDVNIANYIEILVNNGSTSSCTIFNAELPVIGGGFTQIQTDFVVTAKDEKGAIDASKIQIEVVSGADLVSYADGIVEGQGLIGDAKIKITVTDFEGETHIQYVDINVKKAVGDYMLNDQLIEVDFDTLTGIIDLAEIFGEEVDLVSAQIGQTQLEVENNKIVSGIKGTVFGEPTPIVATIYSDLIGYNVKLIPYVFKDAEILEDGMEFSTHDGILFDAEGNVVTAEDLFGAGAEFKYAYVQTDNGEQALELSEDKTAIFGINSGAEFKPFTIAIASNDDMKKFTVQACTLIIDEFSDFSYFTLPAGAGSYNPNTWNIPTEMVWDGYYVLAKDLTYNKEEYTHRVLTELFDHKVWSKPYNSLGDFGSLNALHFEQLGQTKVGLKGKGMQGIFDGRGHVIYDYDPDYRYWNYRAGYNAADGTYTPAWGVNADGLFGVINGGTVKNIGFKNVGSSSYGGFLADMVAWGARLENMFVEFNPDKGFGGWSAAGIAKGISVTCQLNNVVVISSSQKGASSAWGCVCSENSEFIANGLYVISPVPLMMSSSEVKRDAEYVDGVKTPSSTAKLTGAKRYTSISQMVSDVEANAEKLATFDTEYWSVLSGSFPMFTGAIRIEDLEVYVNDVAGLPDQAAIVERDKDNPVTFRTLGLAYNLATSVVEVSDPTNCVEVKGSYIVGLKNGTAKLQATYVENGITVTKQFGVRVLPAAQQYDKDLLFSAGDGKFYELVNGKYVNRTITDLFGAGSSLIAAVDREGTYLDINSKAGAVLGLTTSKSSTIKTYINLYTENSAYKINVEAASLVIAEARDLSYFTFKNNFTRNTQKNDAELANFDALMGMWRADGIDVSKYKFLEWDFVFAPGDFEFDGYYILVNDIDATGYTHNLSNGKNYQTDFADEDIEGWDIDYLAAYAGFKDPVTGKIKGFTGTFDGRGHTISNLTTGKEGLFGAIVGGTVKNVGFVNCNTTTGTNSFLAHRSARKPIFQDIFVFNGNNVAEGKNSGSFFSTTSFTEVTMKNFVLVDADASKNVGADGRYGSLAGHFEERGTTGIFKNNKFSNVYVLSDLPLASTLANGVFTATVDAGIIDGQSFVSQTCKVAEGIKRYSKFTTISGDSASNAENFKMFDSSMWTIKQGSIPVFNSCADIISEDFFYSFKLDSAPIVSDEVNTLLGKQHTISILKGTSAFTGSFSLASSNTDVATVSGANIIASNNVTGTTDITVTYDGSKTFTFTLVVEAPIVKANDVVVTSDGTPLEVGKSLTISLSYGDTAITDFTLSTTSSNVDISGKQITAVSTGTAVITAQFGSASCSFEVSVVKDLQAYAGEIIFSAFDGELPIAQIFGTTDVKIVKATDANGNPLTVSNNKILGVKTNSDGVTNTSINVYSAIASYKIYLKAYTLIIDEVSDLEYFSMAKSNGVHDGYYLLNNDIDATDYEHSWRLSGAAITDEHVGLTGTFDGNGHTISNLKSIGEYGLFGKIAGGTIKNLALTNVNISASSSLARTMVSGTIQDCFISIYAPNASTSPVYGKDALVETITAGETSTVFKNVLFDFTNFLFQSTTATGVVGNLASYNNLVMEDCFVVSKHAVANQGYHTAGDPYSALGAYSQYVEMAVDAKYVDGVDTNANTAKSNVIFSRQNPNRTYELTKADAEKVIAKMGKEPYVNGYYAYEGDKAYYTYNLVDGISRFTTFDKMKEAYTADVSIFEGFNTNFWSVVDGKLTFAAASDVAVLLDGVNFGTSAAPLMTNASSIVSVVVGGIAQPNVSISKVATSGYTGDVIINGNIITAVTPGQVKLRVVCGVNNLILEVAVLQPAVDYAEELIFSAGNGLFYNSKYETVDLSKVFDTTEEVIISKATSANGDLLTIEDNKIVGAKSASDGFKADTITVISGSKVVNIDVQVAGLIIDDINDLSYFSIEKSNGVHDGYYVLTTNLDATGYTHNWKGTATVSTSNTGLTGTFDGNGYVITNFLAAEHGLFGKVNGGTVKNLAFTKIGEMTCSGLIALSLSNDATLDNMYFQFDVPSGVYGRIAIARDCDATVNLKNIFVKLPVVGNDANGGIAGPFVGAKELGDGVENCYVIAKSYLAISGSDVLYDSAQKHLSRVLTDAKFVDGEDTSSTATKDYWVSPYAQSQHFETSKITYTNGTAVPASYTTFLAEKSQVQRFTSEAKMKAANLDYSSFNQNVWTVVDGLPTFINATLDNVNLFIDGELATSTELTITQDKSLTFAAGVDAPDTTGVTVLANSANTIVDGTKVTFGTSDIGSNVVLTIKYRAKTWTVTVAVKPAVTTLTDEYYLSSVDGLLFDANYNVVALESIISSNAEISSINDKAGNQLTIGANDEILGATYAKDGFKQDTLTIFTETSGVAVNVNVAALIIDEASDLSYFQLKENLLNEDTGSYAKDDFKFNGYYILANDIDCQEEGNEYVHNWANGKTTPSGVAANIVNEYQRTAEDYGPLSIYGKGLTGTFDGNGHTISGLTTTGTAGLFGLINGGTIKNLALSNIQSNSILAMSIIGDSLIENCYFQVSPTRASMSVGQILSTRLAGDNGETSNGVVTLRDVYIENTNVSTDTTTYSLFGGNGRHAMATLYENNTAFDNVIFVSGHAMVRPYYANTNQFQTGPASWASNGGNFWYDNAGTATAVGAQYGKRFVDAKYVDGVEQLGTDTKLYFRQSITSTIDLSAGTYYYDNALTQQVEVPYTYSVQEGVSRYSTLAKFKEIYEKDASIVDGFNPEFWSVVDGKLAFASATTAGLLVDGVAYNGETIPLTMDSSATIQVTLGGISQTGATITVVPTEGYTGNVAINGATITAVASGNAKINVTLGSFSEDIELFILENTVPYEEELIFSAADGTFYNSNYQIVDLETIFGTTEDVALDKVTSANEAQLTIVDNKIVGAQTDKQGFKADTFTLISGAKVYEVDVLVAGKIIDEVSDLDYFSMAGSNGIHDGYYLLTKDLDLTDTEHKWNNQAEGVTISEANVGLTGTFDGNGKTINALRNANGNYGLFGKIDGGVIKNLALTNVNIYYSSSLASTMKSATLQDLYISILANANTNAPQYGRDALAERIIAGSTKSVFKNVFFDFSQFTFIATTNTGVVGNLASYANLDMQDCVLVSAFAVSTQGYHVAGQPYNNLGGKYQQHVEYLLDAKTVDGVTATADTAKSNLIYDRQNPNNTYELTKTDAEKVIAGVNKAPYLDGYYTYEGDKAYYTYNLVDGISRFSKFSKMKEVYDKDISIFDNFNSDIWSVVDGKLVFEGSNELSVLINNANVAEEYVLNDGETLNVVATKGGIKYATPATIQQVSGAENVVEINGTQIVAVSAGTVTLKVSVGTFEKQFNLTVLPTATALDGEYKFSADEGIFFDSANNVVSVDTLFGEDVTLARANDSEGNLLTLGDNQTILGVQAGNSDFVQDEITLYTSARAIKVNVQVASLIIDDINDLSYFSIEKSNGVHDGYYVLTTNLDATGYTHNWKGTATVSTSNTGLTGTFDGNGYVITNFLAAEHGLFGKVNGGTVKNLAFTKIGEMTCSGLIALSLSNDATLDNMYFQFDVPSGVYGRIAIARDCDATVNLKNIFVKLPVVGNDANGGIAGPFVGAKELGDGVENCYVIANSYLAISGSDVYYNSEATTRHLSRVLTDAKFVDGEDTSSTATKDYWVSPYAQSQHFEASKITYTNGNAVPASYTTFLAEKSQVQRFTSEAKMKAANLDYSSFNQNVWTVVDGLPTFINATLDNVNLFIDGELATSTELTITQDKSLTFAAGVDAPDTTGVTVLANSANTIVDGTKVTFGTSDIGSNVVLTIKYRAKTWTVTVAVKPAVTTLTDEYYLSSVDGLLFDANYNVVALESIISSNAEISSINDKAGNQLTIGANDEILGATYAKDGFKQDTLTIFTETSGVAVNVNVAALIIDEASDLSYFQLKENLLNEDTGSYAKDDFKFNGYYILANDIDCQEEGNEYVHNWANGKTTPSGVAANIVNEYQRTAEDYGPLSIYGKGLTGTFDGNGHTISGLTTTGTAGLFGLINGGTIKNLALSNIQSNSILAMSIIGDSLIENCYFQVSPTRASMSVGQILSTRLAGDNGETSNGVVTLRDVYIENTNVSTNTSTYSLFGGNGRHTMATLYENNTAFDNVIFVSGHAMVRTYYAKTNQFQTGPESWASNGGNFWYDNAGTATAIGGQYGKRFVDAKYVDGVEQLGTDTKLYFRQNITTTIDLSAGTYYYDEALTQQVEVPYTYRVQEGISRYSTLAKFKEIYEKDTSIVDGFDTNFWSVVDGVMVFGAN